MPKTDAAADRRQTPPEPDTARPAGENATVDKFNRLLNNKLALEARDAERMNTAAMETITRILVYDLLEKKRIPQFYFHEEARRSGISHQETRGWRIREWPTAPFANKSVLNNITRVAMRVTLRLWETEHGDNYWKANARLQRRIRDIMDQGITHNRLAQYLRMSFKSLKIILDKDEDSHTRPKHCPWQLLKQLEHAEREILHHNPNPAYLAHLKRQKQESQEKRQENEALRNAQQQRESRTINQGDKCPKCNAPWASLQFDEQLPGHPVYDQYRCMICSGEAYVKADAIDMYGECTQCGSPWNNLNRNYHDGQGRTVRICRRCDTHNVVKDRAIAPETPLT